MHTYVGSNKIHLKTGGAVPFDAVDIPVDMIDDSWTIEDVRAHIATTKGVTPTSIQLFQGAERLGPRRTVQELTDYNITIRQAIKHMGNTQ